MKKYKILFVSAVVLSAAVLVNGSDILAQTAPSVNLASPTSGATDVVVPVTLEVNVSDAESPTMDVSFYGRGSGAATARDFTLMVIPDTQYYTQLNNGIFELQTNWIAGQKDARNIFFATHEGDVVENWDIISQWNVASTAMATLDPVIPYGINVGNHDMSTSRQTSIYNQYFGPWRYEDKTWYKEGFPAGTNDNSYQLISEGGMDFLFLNLEFCPTSPVIAWADGVLKAHPNHRAVITTHGYLDASGNRNVGAPSGGCVGSTNNTQYMWDQLIFPNPNVFLVLAGHALGESRRTDLNIAGKPVYQLLADYQGRTNGGNGWLRIMTFKPSEDKIYVETYSPYLSQFETDLNSKFVLDYPMDDFSLLGTVSDVGSGENASLVWPNLSPVTLHDWFVKVADAAGDIVTSPIWSFTTEGNFPPVARAGADQTVTDADKNNVETVTLDGSASSDADGTIASYSWSENSVVLGTEAVLVSDFAVGTHVLTLTVADNEGAQSTDTVTLTVNPAPVVRAVHVGNIALTSEFKGSNRNRSCRVTSTVRVLNQDNQNSSGASVSGSWNGSYSANVNGVTDSSGNVIFRTGWVNGCGTFTFGVNNITLSGHVYDSAANTETQDTITP